MQTIIYLTILRLLVVRTEETVWFTSHSQMHKELCQSVHPSCMGSAENISFTPEFPEFLPRGLCCGGCDCDAECYDHGSCCLSDYKNFKAGQSSVENSRYDCVTPQLLVGKSKTKYQVAQPNIYDVWMITNCPSLETVNKTIKYFCENPGAIDSVQTVIPVADGSVHYRNKYCAICNGIESWTSWTVEVWSDVVIPIGNGGLLTLIENARANLFYRPPIGSEPQRCLKQSYNISECNITGLWPVYVESIELACNAFVDVFNYTYKNYFCYVCNTNDPETTGPLYCAQKHFVPNALFPPFHAILNPAVLSPPAKKINCKYDEFPDEKMMICRPILCDEGRHLRHEECYPSSSYSKCYSIYITLTPSKGNIKTYVLNLNDRFYQAMLLNSLLKPFTNLSIQNVDPAFFSKSPSIYKDGVLMVDFFVVRLVAFFNSSYSDDTVSSLFELFHNRTFSIRLPFSQTIDFVSEIELFDDDGIELLVPNVNGTFRDKLYIINIDENILLMPGFEHCDPKTSVQFDKLSICPFVIFGVNEFALRVERDFLFIEEGFMQKTFSKWEYRHLEGDKIALCLSDYMPVYEVMPRLTSDKATVKERSADYISPKELFAFICVCLSVVSLLINLAAYVMVSDFHNQPGINIITLCTSLLLAQTVFQFGAGQTLLSHWACSLIGAICHFLWLTVMFAMNVCSFDMFFIFRRLQKPTLKTNLKQAGKRIIYICVCSFVFVFVNFIASMSLSDGQENGYGGEICYLSSLILHLATFIIPTAIIIFINLVLFGIVAYKISKTTIDAAKLNQERNYFRIFARLSTLTGLTWVFGFLALFLQNETLDYLFILLNAGQGVFIMLAFGLNRRTCTAVHKKIHSSK